MEYSIKDYDKYPKSTGVYAIFFKNGNKKVYIGSASGRDGFKRRWRAHIRDLRLGVTQKNYFLHILNMEKKI